jgi:2-polyprenyl-3-methyl-5-hydroxy-6-metoxy-1,4-benzoquinol methylase
MQYDNYFEEHYKYAFSEVDIINYAKWFEAQLKIISQYINIEINKGILEIGSGIGGFYSVIGEPKKYQGIELDEQAVNFSNNFFKTDKFKVISLEKLGINTQYDYVFAFEVLEHLENPTEAIHRISQLLNSKGAFIGTTPFPYKKNILADETHVSVLHPLNWERLFINEGFKSVRLIPMTFLPFLWRVSKYLNVRIPFYSPAPYCVSTCLIIAKK